MDEAELVAGRDRLLATALERFRAEPGVVGIFLAGSLAAGSGDAFSDIDLRVLATPDAHPGLVGRRREIPVSWPGFLFNEWLPDTQHCISHFRPFNKIDIFYVRHDEFRPSPWYTLPILVLYDPYGMISDVLSAAQTLAFVVSDEEVDYLLSKSLAAAHEAYRQTARGELLYAGTLLEELREHIIKADDILHDRTPRDAVFLKFHVRGGQEVVSALLNSAFSYDAEDIVSALRKLTKLLREQVIVLHAKFRLSRPLDVDLEALAIIAAPT